MKRSIWNHGVGADGSPFTNQYPNGSSAGFGIDASCLALFAIRFTPTRGCLTPSS